MTIRCANRDLPHYANRGMIAEGYGNMSVDRPYSTGYLTNQLKEIFYNRHRNISTVVYSYGTPIAWYDAEFGAWFVPDVTYSVTTSKHQGYLWKLDSERFRIPFDVSYDEYIRVGQRKMVFFGNSTLPGIAWSLD
jgi:hypothetical protein